MAEMSAHLGPWTVEDLATLPVDGQRYEIIDGSLLVSPPAAPDSEVVSRRLVDRLRLAVPSDTAVIERGTISPDARRVLIPDIVVADLTGAAAWLRPDDVRLAVDVLSASRSLIDRLAKPRYYAEMGIPWVWRVECSARATEVVVLRLTRDGYVEETRAHGGRLRVDAPWAVDLSLDELTVPG